jgi:hypothetical protein
MTMSVLIDRKPRNAPSLLATPSRVQVSVRIERRRKSVLTERSEVGLPPHGAHSDLRWRSTRQTESA